MIVPLIKLVVIKRLGTLYYEVTVNLVWRCQRDLCTWVWSSKERAELEFQLKLLTYRWYGGAVDMDESSRGEIIA